MNEGAERVWKVAAVVLRASAGGPEALVFDHPQPEGGVQAQLPAGTVEPGEAPEAAVVRELEEETGVLGVVERLAGVIDEAFGGEARRRWVYVLRATSMVGGAEVGESWPCVCDCGVAVVCRWQALDAPVHPGQQAWLDAGRR